MDSNEAKAPELDLPATCRLCGASQDWRAIEHLVKPRADLYHCQSCDGQFWWPVRNPGADWYESTYAGRNDDPVQSIGWNHRHFLNEKIQAGTVLDVGCGIGHFLAAARDRGWDIYGLDFDLDGIRAAREHYGINTIEPQSVDEYAQANPGKAFSAVTAFEVLEHMEDPIAFIKQVWNLVQPGGYIGISVPYRKVARWMLPHDYPPGHLTRWNRKMMKNFLTSHGFTVIHVYRNGASLERILMRMRYTAGPIGHMNVVSKVKARLGDRAASGGSMRNLTWLRRLARLKDWVILGVPTLAYWLYLRLTRRLYLQLYVLARKSP